MLRAILEKIKKSKNIPNEPSIKEPVVLESDGDPKRMSEIEDIWKQPDFNEWIITLKRQSPKAQTTFLYRVTNSVNKDVFQKLEQYVRNRSKYGPAYMRNNKKQ